MRFLEYRFFPNLKKQLQNIIILISNAIPSRVSASITPTKEIINFNITVIYDKFQTRINSWRNQCALTPNQLLFKNYEKITEGSEEPIEKTPAGPQ